MEDVELTADEQQAALDKARITKAAAINSKNYLAALSGEPRYIIPTAYQIKAALIKELKTAYGWVIDHYNETVIDTLSRYFAMDPAFETIAAGYSLKKGLCFFGPIGCGKTTLMHVLSKNSFNPYTVISCREVANAYAEKEIGHKAIGTYSTLKSVNPRENMGNQFIGYCFDDLGTEPNKKNFGNELNVMAEIILNRYDSRVGIGKTHITTNLAAESIKSEYGPRVASRMREMFNVIEFNVNAPDRRK